MHQALARIRAALHRDARPTGAERLDEDAACSWDAMRAVYAKQAQQGVPEAIRGLERIEQGRWPAGGRQREQ